MTHEEILTTLGHYVDYLIAGSTAEAPLWNIEKVRSGKPNKWNYIDGCMITACLSLYNLRPRRVQPRQRQPGQKPVYAVRPDRRPALPRRH